jgi:ribonuclease VapC
VIVDSSALIAILEGEPESGVMLRTISQAKSRRLSAASFLENSIVVHSPRNAVSSRRFDEMVQELGLTIEPVTEAQARIAREAYRDFGKGSGHKARLNFGDCFSYALARSESEPLLFKGNDFIHTDIRPTVILKTSY